MLAQSLKLNHERWEEEQKQKPEEEKKEGQREKKVRGKKKEVQEGPRLF
jgi:hypothetical protein